METATAVSWDTYARQYDMLLDHNPFYQQLHREVMAEVSRWDIPDGATLADIGAGTGNYSLALARIFPRATVWHIDRDEGMNARAVDKKRWETLPNHNIRTADVQALQLPDSSLRGVISIHALYTFPDPAAVLSNMYQWLAPGGYALFADPGRIVNVLDWQIAIGRHLVRHHGLVKTLRILRAGKEVSRQNAYIRDMQRKGIFWTHSHREFTGTVKNAGFEIIRSKICFRGLSDFVVARKA